MSYSDFIARKGRRFQGDAIVYRHQNPALFPFQRDIVGRALDSGRYCVFADCGLGKTLMELEWASQIPGRVLLLTPLGVTGQIVSEADRFGFDAAISKSGEASQSQITVTNYDRMHRFDPDDYAGVVLDESSILKAHDSKTRNTILSSFAGHRYRLAATATPSPNDFMELGNHAEFVGAMTRAEMLAMYFVHDGGSTQSWRLKGHAKREFWRWVGSWATMIRRPSDLGYDDQGFALPDLNIHRQEVASDFRGDGLFQDASSLSIHERRRARRESMIARCEAAAAIDDRPYLVWTDLNDESAMASDMISGSVEVKGSDSPEHKESALLGFGRGEVSTLVTKPRIGGWGMNWQKCSTMAFVGLSDSYEAFYQAVRRCWRFGQTKPVNVHIIYSTPERVVIDNVLRKESQHLEMQDALIAEANA